LRLDSFRFFLGHYYSGIVWLRSNVHELPAVRALFLCAWHLRQLALAVRAFRLSEVSGFRTDGRGWGRLSGDGLRRR
jgi:hypothetical protein